MSHSSKRSIVLTLTVALGAVTHASVASAQVPFTLPLDGFGGNNVIVFGGPPNTTVMYDITHADAAILGLSHSLAGPWTETLVVNVVLDGSGNGISGDFFIRAEGVGQSLLDGCPSGTSPPCGGDNQVDYSVVTVDTVELIQIGGALTGLPSGETRIFPDKDAPTDAIDRTLVRVKATLTGPVNNNSIFIRFKAFDIDDPSTDSALVDVDGSGTLDNRGSPKNGVLRPPEGGTGTSDVFVRLANAAGVAEANFQVTKHPGDNFRIGTALNPNVISGLAALGTLLVDGQGVALPTVRAKASEMLTVWRRVHIEVDSMGLVAANRVSGTIGAVSTPGPLVSTVMLQMDGLEANRFQGGLLTLSGAGQFSVISNTGSSVDVSGSVTATSGATFVLVDDDDFNGDDGTQLDGDFAGSQGEDVDAGSGPDPVQWPVFSLLKKSDNPNENALAKAYITPEYAGWISQYNSSDRPFVLNVADNDTGPTTARGTEPTRRGAMISGLPTSR